MLYTALGIIFLIYALIMVGVIAYTLISSAKNSGDVISKKNLLYIAPAFVLVYLLYLTSAFYSEQDIDFFYCYQIINYTMEAVFKFKLQMGLISGITAEIPLFYADFVMAVIIGALTVVLGVASFFSQRIYNSVRTNYRLAKNCDVVIGDSSDSLKYFKSTKNSVLLCPEITEARFNELIKSKRAVLRCPLKSKRLAKKLGRGEHNIIVFRDSEYSCTKIIESFSALVGAGCKVYLNLEANGSEKKIIKEKFIKGADFGGSYIMCFNKYELMARRFVAEYPISKYIPREFFNDNFSLKQGKGINVVFVGFGKVNYSLFRTCAMQFQFAAQKGKKLAAKPVHYYIFDKNPSALHNEFFSRINYEFDEDFKACDFPKPDEICTLDVHQEFVNSIAAKKKFKELVDDDSFTYFIISLDNDLEDASYAQTVKRLLKDENSRNYRIFVRAKNNNGERLNDERDPILYFGEEKSLFTHESIVNDDLLELAMRLNLMYGEMKKPWLDEIRKLPFDEQSAALGKALEVTEHRRVMHKLWSDLDLIEQTSNIYRALNMQFKLNLLGFKMVKAKKSDNTVGVTEAQFDERYVNSGRGEGYSDYSFYFGTESSNVLAFIEHSRWNALYIFSDYKQLAKSDMHVQTTTDENGAPIKKLAHKDTARKRHACITTYYGLNDLIEFKYGMLYPEKSFKKADYKTDEDLRELGKIYGYDYIDLDKLYSQIVAMGYKLIQTA